MEQRMAGPLLVLVTKISKEASIEDLEDMFAPLEIRVKVRQKRWIYM